MAIKATAFIYDTIPGTDSGTIALNIRTCNIPGNSVTNIALDNVAPNILDSVLDNDIIAAVKDYWSLGLLDQVRLL